MADDSWLDLAVKAIEVLGIKKILAAFLDKPHYIVVVGSTGVGKTAMQAAVKTVEQQIVNTINRTERLIKAPASISGVKTVLVDTPGEIAKVASRMREMASLFAKPRVGVLIVVADGYHQYRAATGSEINSSQKLSAYLQQHRQIEIDHLTAFASQFPFSQDVDWALTVATKADLWWDDRARVIDYYASDAFQDIARRICPYGAAPRPFSSATELFLGKFPGSRSFDEIKRREIRLTMLESILSQMAT